MPWQKFLKRRWPWATVTASSRARDLLANPKVSGSIAAMNAGAAARFDRTAAVGELGAAFFALAVVAGVIARLSFDDMARHFVNGAGELIGTALLIGFARAIQITLDDGQVLHTIVHGLSQPLLAVGAELSAVGMLFIQSALNFFVPSGSGQAYVTMPIMGPIADIVGVSRQVAVLAYQMGDGFMNMIVPTNAVLMGILGICGIPYGRWFRFIWPLMLQLLVLGSITMVVAVLIDYR